MNKEQGDNERRRDARYERNFSLRVGDNSDGLKAESINISSRGLYCKVPRYVQPFSKLRIALDLPFVSREPGKVECEAVVVRVEPDVEDPATREYRLAIYFLNLDRPSAEMVQAFLAEGH